MPSKYSCLIFNSASYTVIYEALLVNVSEPSEVHLILNYMKEHVRFEFNKSSLLYMVNSQILF